MGIRTRNEPMRRQERSDGLERPDGEHAGPDPHTGGTGGFARRRQRIEPAEFDDMGWNLIAVQNHLQQIRAIWARGMEVSAPQLLILSAVRDMDRDVGVSVSEVSARMLVDASFVTTQSKALEKMTLLRRTPSKTDARVVLMSLTDKARRQFATLASHQEFCANLIFADWGEDALPGLNETLRSLSQRLARTAVIIAADT